MAIVATLPAASLMVVLYALFPALVLIAVALWLWLGDEG